MACRWWWAHKASAVQVVDLVEPARVVSAVAVVADADRAVEAVAEAEAVSRTGHRAQGTGGPDQTIRPFVLIEDTRGPGLRAQRSGTELSTGKISRVFFFNPNVINGLAWGVGGP